MEILFYFPQSNRLFAAFAVYFSQVRCPVNEGCDDRLRHNFSLYPSIADNSDSSNFSSITHLVTQVPEVVAQPAISLSAVSKSLVSSCKSVTTCTVWIQFGRYLSEGLFVKLRMGKPLLGRLVHWLFSDIVHSGKTVAPLNSACSHMCSAHVLLVNFGRAPSRPHTSCQTTEILAGGSLFQPGTPISVTSMVPIPRHVVLSRNSASDGTICGRKGIIVGPGDYAACPISTSQDWPRLAQQISITA